MSAKRGATDKLKRKITINLSGEVLGLAKPISPKAIEWMFAVCSSVTNLWSRQDEVKSSVWLLSKGRVGGAFISSRTGASRHY